MQNGLIFFFLQAAVEPAVLETAASSMTRRVPGKPVEWKASCAAVQEVQEALWKTSLSEPAPQTTAATSSELGVSRIPWVRNHVANVRYARYLRTATIAGGIYTLSDLPGQAGSRKFKLRDLGSQYPALLTLRLEAQRKNGKSFSEYTCVRQSSAACCENGRD